MNIADEFYNYEAFIFSLCFDIGEKINVYLSMENNYSLSDWFVYRKTNEALYLKQESQKIISIFNLLRLAH